MREAIMRSQYWIRLFLISILHVNLGTSEDFSSLSEEQIINHGDIDINKTSTYQKEEDPNRIILQESVLSTDNNVYVAFMLKSCQKHINTPDPECTVLRIYENYDQLRVNPCEKQLGSQCFKCASDLLTIKMGLLPAVGYHCHGCLECWNYQFIWAKCRLPTMRIAYGFIICEEIGGNKPSIVKISVKTGEVVQRRILDDAKTIMKCFDSDPECSGKHLDVNVHIMVDTSSVWILYNGREQNGILEHIDLNSLLSIKRIQVDVFDSNNRALVISDKFYLLSISNDRLRINKAIDTNNTRNAMSNKVTLLNKLQKGVNWVHYNPRLEKLFVGHQSKRITYVYTVNKCPYEYPDSVNFDEPSVKSTFLWSIYADDPAHYQNIIQTITSFFQVKDPKKLNYISSVLLTCPYTKCHQYNATRPYHCRLNDIRSSFESFAKYKDSAVPTNLQADLDMVKLLEQSQYQELSSKLNSFQTLMNGNHLNVKQRILSLRSSLGSYFSTFANFDLRKSNTDLELFNTIFDELNAKQNAITPTIKDKLQTLFHEAVGSNAAEIVGQAVNVLIAGAAFANPFSFFDMTDQILQMQDRLANLAKAAVDTVKLIRIINVYFPRLKNIADDLTPKIREMANKFPNMKNLVKKAMEKTLDDEEIVRYTDVFLKEYDSYRPAYDPSTIDEYEAILGEIVNELCRIIYAGGSLTAAIAQGVLASRDTCLATKLDVQTLMGLFRDMFDKQSILLNAFASAVRATAARLNAERIQDIPNQIESGNFIETEINYKLSALEILMNSKIHTLLITREACSLIKYKNGNVLPRYCSKAINSAGASSGGVIMLSSRLNRDMCDGVVVQKYVYIPAQQQSINSTVPKGSVDLTRLYRGDEVIFQIPNGDWLIKHKWIDNIDKDKMIVLKEFELFIPTNSSSEISVRSSLRYMSHNVIKPGGKTYDLNTPELYQYNLRYNQRATRCLEEMLINMPYNLPSCPELPPICLISRGKMRHPTIYPSIYSKFGIKLSTKNSKPAPKPKTNFFFIASVKLCIVEPAATRRKRSNSFVTSQNERNVGKSIHQRCCGNSNEYFDILNAEQVCKPCPPNSTAKFGGLYCE